VLQQARDVLDRLRQADLSIAAAAVAYNGFLALVPLAVAMVGIAAIVGGDASAVERVERALDPIAPEEVTDFVLSLMIDADARLGGGEIWLIAGSGLVALFLGSRAVVAMQRGLALVEGTVEARPALQMRLVGVALTVAAGVSLILTSIVLVAGRGLFAFVGGLVGWEGITSLWAWLRLPVAGLGLYAFLLAFYSWGPPEPVTRPRLAALTGTGGIVVGSLGFGWYLSMSPALGATFGILGAVAVALVWLYIGALSMLAGAVLAHAVDDRHGTPPRPAVSAGQDDEAAP
jgi:membrane protein